MNSKIVICLHCGHEYRQPRSKHLVIQSAACPKCGNVGWAPVSPTRKRTMVHVGDPG